MNSDDSINYVFDNELLTYESYNKDFTDEIYKEFKIRRSWSFIKNR